jgi:long-subunit acyl-CoA synthetase (AMP-forming)
VISLELENAVQKRFNNKIVIRQGYGMTETTLSVIKHGLARKPGSIGSLLRGVQAKVIDEIGKSLPAFERGELCFRGSRIMKGYLGDEKATRETIDEDGWLHTGDVGYYDEDQQFYIVDRKKELIKYNAHQVSFN